MTQAILLQAATDCISEQPRFLYYKDKDFVWIINQETNIYYYVSIIKHDGLTFLSAIRRFNSFEKGLFVTQFKEARQITGLQVCEEIGQHIMRVLIAATKVK